MTVCLKSVTDVVVKMFEFVLARRDSVDVYVKDVRRKQLQILQARLFARLAPGSGKHVGVALDVAAELHPKVQLAVMCQEGVRQIFIHDPGGTGQMSDL